MAVLTKSRGAAPLKRAQLASLPAPKALGSRHLAVSHAEMVESLDEAFKARAMDILREELYVQRDTLLIGFFDVRPAHFLSDGETDWLLAFRSSTDKSTGLRAIAGRRVRESGAVIFQGKQVMPAALRLTQGKSGALTDTLQAIVDRFFVSQQTLEAKLAGLREKTITDERAKAFVHDIFAARMFPSRLFPEVAESYFASKRPAECQPRTALALLYAFARAMKQQPPITQIRDMMRLAQSFGL